MVSNVRNAANSAVVNIRNSAAAVIPEQRTYTFYYVLIISLFVVLAVITYFFSTIKEFLQSLFFKIKPTEEPPLTPEDPLSGVPDAVEGNSLKKLAASISHREEVFHISNNIYTYSDAAAVCRSFGADLATESQLHDAYAKGADWCSYGWIKGQQAVYPTQQATYDSLQKGPVDKRDSCGKVGLNGGYFDNPDLRFGVTCYGMKPESSKTNALGNRSIELPPSTEEIEFEKKVQRFRDQADATTVDPWNRSGWNSS